MADGLVRILAIAGERRCTNVYLELQVLLENGSLFKNVFFEHVFVSSELCVKTSHENLFSLGLVCWRGSNTAATTSAPLCRRGVTSGGGTTAHHSSDGGGGGGDGGGCDSGGVGCGGSRSHYAALFATATAPLGGAALALCHKRHHVNLSKGRH